MLPLLVIEVGSVVAGKLIANGINKLLEDQRR